MKIKSFFVILLIGIAVIPIFLFGTMTFIFYYRSLSRVFISEETATEIINLERTDRDIEHFINRYINSLPHMMDCIALDKDGNVLFSTIQKIPENSVLKKDDIFHFIKTTGEGYFFGLDRAVVGSIPEDESTEYVDGETDLSGTGKGELIYFLTRVKKDNSGPRRFLKDGFFIIIGVSDIILLFAITISIFIIRQITSSLTMLKDAVKTMEAGNLDKEIKLKSNNEIMILAEYLDHMRQGLKNDQIRRSRFLMGLSHDLRTPVALIKGYTEAIRDGMADDPAMLAKSLDIIDTKITQLESLLNALIDSVRLETSEWKGKQTECNLNSFFLSYGSRISQDGNLLRRHINTEIDIPKNLFLLVDEEILSRFLENIVSNSFRYTQEGGVIKFSAIWFPSGKDHKKRKIQSGDIEGKNGRLEVVISDNGCGIAEADLPFIFDPFYRGTNSRREEGYGFGLAAVKHIADTYSWTVDVDSKQGEGTTFAVSIYDCIYNE